ncbi:hypothetical protein Pcinc_028775 [Petrolisthes cinctipes]|uniref:Uncharacterized protein n=1 Tax=Petrolisthes cinctipes TaxID=88211 RepID=A0AAE1EV04_PETCI|nr:hypothetical protein Pcinc_032333 [Petrolisthes cinctipes]KAK3865633.1 hypothetical protein Pcinc_028775 [Petrolisthes cinctipes]
MGSNKYCHVWACSARCEDAGGTAWVPAGPGGPPGRGSAGSDGRRGRQRPRLHHKPQRHNNTRLSTAPRATQLFQEQLSPGWREGLARPAPRCSIPSGGTGPRPGGPPECGPGQEVAPQARAQGGEAAWRICGGPWLDMTTHGDTRSSSVLQGATATHWVPPPAPPTLTSLTRGVVAAGSSLLPHLPLLPPSRSHTHALIQHAHSPTT